MTQGVNAGQAGALPDATNVGRKSKFPTQFFIHFYRKAVLMIVVRLLTVADAEAYRTLRLRSLQEHPAAFGSSYEEEAAIGVEKTVERIQNSLPYTPFFGAFEAETLIGITTVWRDTRSKTRHSAMITGVYVVPTARGKGAAQALLSAALAYLREQAEVRLVKLAVTVGNETARRLYVQAGFVAYGIEPLHIRVGEQFYDLEWLALKL
jgi:RimJ/RimL family protein N-acetyltransferase